jgi:hypothetical protein
MRIRRARCQNPLGRAAHVSQEVIEHTAGDTIFYIGTQSGVCSRVCVCLDAA